MTREEECTHLAERRLILTMNVMKIASRELQRPFKGLKRNQVSGDD